MSNLKDILNPTVATGSADFIASGTLPNGAPVVLKSDGTVEAAALVTAAIAESIPAGAEAVFHTGEVQFTSTVFDPNNANKFVTAYQDYGNLGYGTAVVGTVSGTSITFGTEVVFNAGMTNHTFASFDPNTAGKFVVAYKDSGNSHYGTVIVGTLSGTTLTFGTEVVFNSGNSSDPSVAFDPNTAGKFVVSYMYSSTGYSKVGTLSGTSATFGTAAAFNSGAISDTSMAFDPNTAGKFVVSYNDHANSYYGTAIVGTVSGTSVSFGTEAVFSSDSSTTDPRFAFDPNNAGKFVIAYSYGNASIGSVKLGTVSGTSVSFGTEVIFNTGSGGGASRISIAFNPNTANKFVMAYQDYGTASGIAVVGTVSGTTISLGTNIVFNPSFSSHTSISFDPNTAGKFVIAYTDSGNSSSGTAIVGQLALPATSNLTSTNFLGTSNATYTDTQTATVMLQGGVSDNQTGLTIGSTYYVQPDGTLATSAGTPSVEAGKALSATSLLLSDTADPAVALNTAKVTNSTSASDLTSGTLPDARFPATLPAISGANLTNLPASASDFTSITEGSNTGYGTSERSANPNNYGDIGNLATDLSYSQGSSTTRGATGEYSTALGRNTIASGLNSFTTGVSNTASGNYSIAMGGNSEASANYAFVFGEYSYASGLASFAVGTEVEAIGTNSVALGFHTIAKGNNSVALNYDTTAAGIYSTAMGKFGGVGTAGTTLLGVAFGASDPGNIKSTSTDTNLVFKVSTAGDGYFDGVADSAAADYAEYFESADGSELERGYFVSFAQGSECVEYGNSELVGIVSAAPAVVGDSQSLHYKGKYQKDEFGAYIREPVKLYDDDGVYTHTEIHKVLSEDFDPTQEYLPRSERPEWSPIGLLGKLWVHLATGETIVTGDYVTSDSEGKAIKCLRADIDSFRVISINSERNLVRVLYK